jgi:hypothetical protein
MFSEGNANNFPRCICIHAKISLYLKYLILPLIIYIYIYIYTRYSLLGCYSSFDLQMLLLQIDIRLTLIPHAEEHTSLQLNINKKVSV